MRKIFVFMLFILIQYGCKQSLVGPPRETNSINVGIKPIIITPEEGEWFACNQPVTYCWKLPDGVSEQDVVGYELQFSNTETPDGPWDPMRFFSRKCWCYGAGHQGTYDALYWRVRIVFEDGSRSEWAVSYHQVGVEVPGEGSPPIIITPEEGEWFACNQPVTYCWELPDGVSEQDVVGYELQFSNTETPDGPWDPVRFFGQKCWYCGAGHQGTYDALYWRVRIVFEDGSRSEWAVSYHQVG